MAVRSNDRGFNQAKVEVLTLIELNGVVKAFGKTVVLGPERMDSLMARPSASGILQLGARLLRA